MKQSGFIQFKAVAVLCLGFLTWSVWLLEVASVAPESAWERVVNSFLGALPALIAAIVAAWVALHAANKVAENTELTKATGVQVDKVAVQTDGHMTVLEQALAVATAKIDKQDKTIADLIARMDVKAPITVDAAGVVRETKP